MRGESRARIGTRLAASLAAVLLLGWPGVAAGDHVEVTNGRAVLRAESNSDSERIRGLDDGELLDMRAIDEENGWIPVVDHVSGRDGWVFRSFVRFRDGDRPGAEAPVDPEPPVDPDPTDPGPSGADAPGLPHGFYVIEQEHYDVGFDPRLKIPVWVQYTVRASDLDGDADRTGLDFVAHDGVPEDLQADDDDYHLSGFAKGHMAPAEDMTRSDLAMLETFFYTNAAPQLGPSFNGSKWSVLERKTREWVRARGELIVVMGPVFDRAPPDEPSSSPNSEEAGWVKYRTIGDGEIAVAHGFFKVIYDPQRLEALAFLMPHRSVTGDENPVTNFVVTIDEIERRAGIDLLPDLPEAFEETLEALRATELWAGIQSDGDAQAPIAVPGS